MSVNKAFFQQLASDVLNQFGDIIVDVTYRRESLTTEDSLGGETSESISVPWRGAITPEIGWDSATGAVNQTHQIIGAAAELAPVSPRVGDFIETTGGTRYYVSATIEGDPADAHWAIPLRRIEIGSNP